MKNILQKLTIAFLLVSAPSAFSAPAPGTKKVTIFFPDNGNKPYSNSAATFTQLTFMQAVFGQLLYVSSGFNLEPGLIRRYHWDFNESCYVLELADNLRFHNGRLANSSDLEFSLLRPLLIKELTWEQTLLLNIRGADKIKKGDAFHPGMLGGLKVIDAKTVKVFLRAPNPAFLFSLTRSTVPLMPREELNSDLISWKRLPIGAGSFRVVSEDSGGSLVHTEVVTSKNDGSPDAVDFATKGDVGKADVLLGVATNPDPHRFSTDLNSTVAGVTVLQFNANSELGRNQDFRNAIKYGIDRTKLIGDDIEKVPAYEILPGSHWGRLNAGDTFDLQKAKAALKKVPRRLLQDEIVMPAYAATLTNFKNTPIGRLEDQMRMIGIPIRFDLTGEIQKVRKQGESPLFGTGIAVDYIDPLIVFSFFLSKGQFGGHMPKDPAFEALYDKATMASSFDVRVDTVRHLSRYFFDRNCVLPLWERKTIYHFNKAVIADLGAQRGGGTFYVDKIRLH